MCVTGFLGSWWLPADTATFMDLGSSEENEKEHQKQEETRTERVAFWKQGKRFRKEQGTPSESSSHVSTEKGTPVGKQPQSWRMFFF